MNNSIPLELVERADATGRPERRDAVANRARLLETAQRLFNERGVAEVCMAEIAEAAGVGKGTLYRHFASKGALCLALMDSQLLEFQNRTLGQLRAMTGTGVHYVEQLEQFLEELVYFTEEHTPLLYEVQREGIETVGDASTPHLWLYLTVRGLLEKARTAGEFPADLDVVYLADLILSSLSAQFFRFQRQERGYSLERIYEGLRSLVRNLAS
ncbi:MAG: TetR/AcrR family transcriptional regulator [Chloroflexi bacterium]|nr:TetR/AcrR family transcriptional regulator [Chloroflexota bacterium]MCI0575366.1 TetR/AcrR family transcriptional regulator [Chloroflexota bacterium]MCI0646386.1 TetR/AcrR family transcriptional regulator [Chloroflexota bacterium]MCI0728356.1 TetR/AcrR family transcriptional regulator [Chloroflexota bacterium]